MKRPLCSVIIPVFNQERYIDLTIRSVLGQTFRDLELIVVDDGSTDGTPDVLSRFAAADSRVRIISRENGGVAAARNDGIRAASADWIAFLDSDDLWFETKLERCFEEIDRLNGGVNLLSHDEKLIDAEGREVGDNVYDCPARDHYRYLLLEANCLSPSALLVEKSVLYRSGLFNTSPYVHTVEDYDLWIRLARLGPIHFFHEFLGAYRLHPDGISRNLRVNYLNTINVLVHNLLKVGRFSNESLLSFYYQTRWALFRRMLKLAKMARHGDPATCAILLKEMAVLPFKPLDRVLNYNKRNIALCEAG